MLNKLIFGGLCMVLLAGCNDSSEVQVGVADQDAKATAEKIATDTAIYLPGGAGVDFKRKPISDNVTEDKLSKIRIVQYGFSETYDVIDKSIASVLDEQGYSRKVNPAGGNKLSVSYNKGNARPTLLRYASAVKQGSEMTVLTISWRF